MGGGGGRKGGGRGRLKQEMQSFDIRRELFTKKIRFFFSLFSIFGVCVCAHTCACVVWCVYMCVQLCVYEGRLGHHSAVWTLKDIPGPQHAHSTLFETGSPGVLHSSCQA